ncbi:putative RNA methyltransferase [Nesterenkonia muleiensis]|uniref:putative RNA methyltransferase n=1 Tax=Nesterenkonia muleiensis TaxID=2282648 RepID=UPI000E722F79|nr:hypothetical protein [Nesterenkonia muleiensis]
MSEKSPPADIPGPILHALRCPLCGQQLEQDAARLHCPSGHSFDRAKQGHITLRRGGPTPKNADTPAMVAAREALLDTSLYEPIKDQLSAAVAAQLDAVRAPLVADLGGGTGYYLAGVLDRLPNAHGVCIDLSAAALKRAARCHLRAAAIGSNLLADPLPLATGSVAVATSIFGPRNVPEIQRVLGTGGLLVVATPTKEHLAELVEPLGMLQVDQRKDERLAASLTAFTQIAAEHLTYRVPVSSEQAGALVRMGPSAHHITADDLDARLRHLPDDLTITVSVNLGLYTMR